MIPYNSGRQSHYIHL